MPPVVLVIDHESLRASAMASAFKGLDCFVIQVWKTIDGIQSSPPTGLPRECTIRLWHLRDLYAECRDLQAALTIYYGGDGGKDPARPRDGGEIIWRPVGRDQSGVLTRFEAEALLRFAQDRETMPAILKPPAAFESLGALALLCQGYLAVHAANGACEGSVAADMALQRMGWTPENATYLTNPESLAEVQTPSWWLGAFDIQRDDGPDHPKWQAVRDSVGREWGAFENLGKVKALLDRMTDAKPAPVEIVADAYCAIAGRLKAELSGRLDSSGR